MQTSGVYASASPHPLYQNAYHAVLVGPQDHELKKQYLALLPPQQIIDICLNFDLYVPPYVKSSIWPADINAAIAAMRRTSQPTTDPPVASSSSSTDAPPAMGSLIDPADASLTAAKSIEQPGEAQPPDKPSPTPDPSTSAQTSAQPSPAPPEQTTPAPPPFQQPPYPHQPYGYGHPQAAYPHAPYYQHPSGYPYPSPYAYPQMPSTYAPPPHPGYPQQHNVPFTTAPLTHPPQQQQDTFNPNPTMSSDDLPSYEEMIVAALLDSGDPEGCAPKDLFTWMASRYPLQSNFRPSASQALQKAFKRGRFQKSSGGKYRLNATWEGGSTSRRTTRRPQTQNAPAAAAPASPFTHAPLVHHNQPAQNQGYQAPGYTFPFQQPPQGYPGFQQHQQAPQQPPQPQPGQPSSVAAVSSTDAATHTHRGEGAVHDAWEAAQNILKAINFDSLLQLPDEDEKAGDHDKAVAGPSNAAALVTATAGADLFAGIMAGDLGTSGGASTAEYAAGRAELQAQLALLAAQLAELSQEDDADPVVHYPVVGSAPPAAPPTTSVVPGVAPPVIGSFPSQIGVPLPGAEDSLGASQQPPPPPPPVLAVPEEEEDSEDDDMEEVM